ncbi:transcriptional attenuator, LytR family [Clostridium cavendishii DSM 21758]|uniref:Transcriptional attenuator, LytR family n=1 Tax=Clostridium cavendishii DSM 21758 TaxID=1121302 RepID=A0A1M6QD24_9CLOT|nr:LCP family protein [Clostridium cavendishii]SHK18088.1 transcriptional attenuator, LytR family [Clostridium cavendishii DSM 21758]
MSIHTQMQEKNKTTKKRKSKKFKIIISIIVVLLIILVAGATSIYKLYSRANRVSINDDKKNLQISDEAEKLAKENKVKNILLIGSDEGTVDDHGRSDSMIVISVDRKNKKIKTTSFMRDMLLTLPGIGEKNLNNAYAFGGSELLVKTMNYNFGLDITDYVKVDFGSFIKIIDKLGGVDIDIKQDELQSTNTIIDNLCKGELKIEPIFIKKAGVNTLNGMQALGYSRNRTTGNDFDRTNRQRIVLQAVLDKISKAGYVDGLKYANDILPDVTTTLSIGEISDIGQWVVLNKIHTFESNYFPKSEEAQHVVTNEYHMVVDKEKLKKEVQEYIYNDKR